MRWSDPAANGGVIGGPLICQTENNVAMLEVSLGEEFIIKLVFAVSLMLPFCLVHAGESLVRSQADLLSAPKISSEKVLILEVGVPVTTGSRRGLWIEVLEPLPGWVKLRHLRRTSGSKTSSSLNALQSGRRGVGNAVSSSGVRGLDSEMITLSAPDYSALEDYKAFLVASLDGQRFASDRRLLGREVAYLSDPQSRQRSASRNGTEEMGADTVVKKIKPSRKKKVVADDDW
jgi:hypothetical protein